MIKDCEGVQCFIYGNEDGDSFIVVKILTLCMLRARAGSIIQVAVARDKFVSAKIGGAFFSTCNVRWHVNLSLLRGFAPNLRATSTTKFSCWGGMKAYLIAVTETTCVISSGRHFLPPVWRVISFSPRPRWQGEGR